LRGFVGGIVGFAYNATISRCSWEGNSIWLKSDKSDNQAPYKAGIVGGFGKGTIENCTAKGGLNATKCGSALSADAGGIVAHIMGSDAVNITGCSYFGNLDSFTTNTAEKTTGNWLRNLGGIVGLSSEQTTVSKCKFGGNYNSLDVSENNFGTMVFGNNLGTATELSYWNGN